MAHVFALETDCGAMTDSLGYFELTLPDRDETILRVERIYFSAIEQFTAAGEDVEGLVLTLPERSALRVREWSSFGERPEAVTDPIGVEGCYWLGASWSRRDDSVRRLTILPNGTARLTGVERDLEWSLEGRRMQVILFGRPGPAFGSDWINLLLPSGDDWSAIPTELHDKSHDARLPREVDTFSVRVPCRTGGDF